MSANVDNTNVDDTPITSGLDPLYKIGDIVIINSNGSKQKRHIYGNPYWEKSAGGIDTWKYPVDYGLGLTSEGVITEGQIIRKSKSGPPSEGGDDHICL